MLGSVLPFSPELADRVSEYCEKHSEALPEVLDKHWKWTVGHFVDAEMMSSKLQGQWMIWMAQWVAPKRVAWYDGTRANKAEIVTLDTRNEVLEQTCKFFKELGVDDRITVTAGPAAITLEKIEGEFDLIFLDADKKNNGLYLDIILEQRLLSPKGIVLVDNVFARGITMGNELNPYLEPLRRPFWETAGEEMREVNKVFREDPRVDTLMLPLFDGVTQIKWKEGYLDKSKD